MYSLDVRCYSIYRRAKFSEVAHRGHIYHWHSRNQLCLILKAREVFVIVPLEVSNAVGEMRQCTHNQDKTDCAGVSQSLVGAGEGQEQLLGVVQTDSLAEVGIKRDLEC